MNTVNIGPPGGGIEGGRNRSDGGVGPYVPTGYTRSTINGVPVTYNGRAVYDNGIDVIYL